MSHPVSKGKVFSFKAAQDAASRASPPTQKQKPSSPSPTKVGGYAEVWLKANTDKDALIKENLALKAQQRKLEEEKQELVPTFKENLVYYTFLGIALGVAIILVFINR